jgi:hypothetical protein
MQESSDSPLDPFSIDEPTVSDKVGLRPEKTSSLLELPKNQGRFSQTSQAILEELRVRHRRLEMHGSAEIAPSLLLTIDKISDVLQKEVQLTENHKTLPAISEALAELSDSQNQFKTRSVYFYPFLLRIESGISIRIVLVAPQNKDKTDIIPYRRACFKYSEEILLMVFKNLAKQDPIIDESKPGKVLLERDEKGNLNFYPNRFSAENDLHLITNKGFSPYAPFVIPDFVTDAIQFANTKQLLFIVNPNYHIVVSNVGFVEVLLKHVAVQLDALAAYVFQYLKNNAKENQHFRFIDVIEDLESRLPDTRSAIMEGGWKIAYEFVTLIKEFPFDEKSLNQNLQIKQTCTESSDILEKLLAEIQKKGRDVHEEKYSEILRKVKDKVIENTMRNLVLTPVDVELELTPLFSVSKFDKQILIDRFVDDLTLILGAYPLKDKTEKLICYTVDQRYLRDVFDNTISLSEKDPKFKEEIKYLDTIRKDLLGRNDSQLDLLSESSSKQTETDNTETEKQESKKVKVDINQLQSTFHFPTAIITSLIGSVIATISSLVSNQLDLLVGGVFLSVFAGIILSYFINKMKVAPKEKASNKKPVSGVASDSFLTLVRAAETVLFPKKFNSIFEKVYDPKKLKYTIEENLEEIRNLLPPADRKKEEAKLVAEIEYAVLQSAVIIKVPEEVQIKGRSREFILSKNDLKTLFFRDKLAEHFRKEASVYKNDTDMMAYLNFLIKEIEFGYTKYTKA